MASVAAAAGDAQADHGTDLPDPPLGEQLDVILEQYEAMLDLYGPVIGANCARKHIGWYTRGLYGSAISATASTRSPIPLAAKASLRAFYEPWLERAAA
jgi:tRNA-dihydrouridine synthase B